jgi:hypothetical protein
MQVGNAAVEEEYRRRSRYTVFDPVQGRYQMSAET